MPDNSFSLQFLMPSADTWQPVEAAHVQPGCLLTLPQWRELQAHWPQDLAVGLLLDNDADVQALDVPWHRFETIALRFPKWTDGRAYTQAVLLRRRLRYRGLLRAAGDVVVDMAIALARTGFDVLTSSPPSALRAAA